jgi:uncharacterized membrane protein
MPRLACDMGLSSAPTCLDNQIEDSERTGGSVMKDQDSHRAQATFGPAEIGALAHLYRGEMYQSKVWRNRLDTTTTNWAVVITGIALSVTFSNAAASPIPILLVSWVVVVFLLFEARRYLYYDLFRVRVRVMEINFYGPILRGQGMRTDKHWNDLLAEDYEDLKFHISLMEALGRRIRRTYGWIFAVLLACYLAKIFVHPTPLTLLDELWARAAIGPIPGEVALGVGLLFHGTWIAVALLTLGSQKAIGLPHRRTGPDLLLEVAGGTSGRH